MGSPQRQVIVASSHPASRGLDIGPDGLPDGIGDRKASRTAHKKGLVAGRRARGDCPSVWGATRQFRTTLMLLEPRAVERARSWRRAPLRRPLQPYRKGRHPNKQDTPDRPRSLSLSTQAMLGVKKRFNLKPFMANPSHSEVCRRAESLFPRALPARQDWALLGRSQARRPVVS
jgi:hypothetical protein